MKGGSVQKLNKYREALRTREDCGNASTQQASGSADHSEVEVSGEEPFTGSPRIC
jgi:hypothetical protein